MRFTPPPDRTALDTVIMALAAIGADAEAGPDVSKLMAMDGAAKMLMGAGAALFAFGGCLWLASKLGWLPLGRLPGDVAIHRDGVHIYFPIVTCLVLSIIGSLALWLLGARRH